MCLSLFSVVPLFVPNMQIWFELTPGDVLSPPVCVSAPGYCTLTPVCDPQSAAPIGRALFPDIDIISGAESVQLLLSVSTLNLLHIQTPEHH